MSPWSDWIGKSETRSDIITPELLHRFCATFDIPVTDEIPQGLHWCLCLPDTPTAQLAEDGHPEKGGFLPPIPLPRRMWASSNVTFYQPLRPGDEVSRISTIASVDKKSGMSGDLVFVAIDHETRVEDRMVVSERQNIVYRQPANTPPSVRPPGNIPPDIQKWDWQREIIPCEKLLFRYSALTFNSHRIHYDQPYATNREGYPGLVVQGPLMATLLLELAARNLGTNRLSRFSFRGRSPAYADAAINLVGKRSGEKVSLAIIGATGTEIMTAEAAIQTC